MTLSIDQLVGSWRLVSADEVLANGTRRPEFGNSASGYLSYTADGIVSAVLGDANRPESGTSDPQRATDDEIIRMARGYIAYAGPFTIDAGNDTVIHHIDTALFADWQGAPQARHVRINGHHLHITGSPRVNAEGVHFHSELHWTRVAPHPPTTAHTDVC